MDQGNQEAKTFLDIRVLSVNERPLFNSACAKNNLCSFQVNEAKSINSVIGTLAATDPDGDQLTYELKTSNAQDKVFAIDVSGRITLLKSLDREVKPFYRVVVKASDGGTPVLAVETLVSIAVTDANDNAPKFPFNSYTASVYENAASGSTVIQVIAVGK
jgi:hypothetical protein